MCNKLNFLYASFIAAGPSLPATAGPSLPATAGPSLPATAGPSFPATAGPATSLTGPCHRSTSMDLFGGIWVRQQPSCTSFSYSATPGLASASVLPESSSLPTLLLVFHEVVDMLVVETNRYATLVLKPSQD